MSPPALAEYKEKRESLRASLRPEPLGRGIYGLHKVMLRRTEQFADRADIAFIEERLCQSRPEKVVYAGFSDDPDTLPNRFDIHGDAGQLAVAPEGRLDVHGDEVDESGRHDRRESVGKAAVRVELDKVPQRSYSRQQCREIVVHEGFPAAHHYSLQPADSRPQKAEHFVHIEGLSEARGVDELRVVAVGAAKVAALREDDGADVPRVVDERAALQSAYEHSFSLLSLNVFRSSNSTFFPLFHCATGRR